VQQHANDFHWSPARRTLAALAALRGSTAEALDHLAAVEAQARSEGLDPDLAFALLERARLTSPARRGPILAEARALFDRLGMRRDLARTEALSEAPSRDGSPPGGLSGREVEVLRLIAQGMTNREIASALVISERTVANHLSHIFTKIAVDNRASAAAFAFRNGLAGDAPA
jgi:DNA-binding NarL/FixJ family response regulator